jgi:Flp pilus assembly protein TadG
MLIRLDRNPRASLSLWIATHFPGLIMATAIGLEVGAQEAAQVETQHVTTFGSSADIDRRYGADGIQAHDLAGSVHPASRLANRYWPNPRRDRCMRSITAAISPLRRIGTALSRHDLNRCRRGVAALEFALATTPFLMMVFGFISANLIFITWSNMQNAAYNAAFLMATGQVTSFQSRSVTCTSSLSTASAEYYACQNLPSWASFTATATESCTAPATVTVQVSTSAAAMAGTDIYSFFAGRTVMSNATMIKQGTCP